MPAVTKIALRLNMPNDELRIFNIIIYIIRQNNRTRASTTFISMNKLLTGKDV